MSSGADCSIYETKDGWFYRLQQWPYGENPNYDTYGPFKTFKEADNHLSSHHQNPGAFDICPLRPKDFDWDNECYPEEIQATG